MKNVNIIKAFNSVIFFVMEMIKKCLKNFD